MRNELESVNADMLPPQVRRLVKVIGLPDTLTLLKQRGGTRLTLPVRPELAVELPKLIPADSVRKICNSELAGQRLDLPKSDKIMVQLRNQAILAEKGKSTKRETAQRYGLTTRMIKLIWNGESDDNPTPDMFS